RNHDASHHGQAQITNLSKLVFQMANILIEPSGQFGQMTLLPFFAGHAIGLAIDHNGHLRHSITFVPQRSRTARMVSIAVTNRRDTSRLTSSSLLARNSDWSSS